jgi:hypothetical protein
MTSSSRSLTPAAVFLAASALTVAVFTGCTAKNDPGDLSKIAVGPPPGGYPKSSAPAVPGAPGATAGAGDLCKAFPPDEVLAMLDIPGTAVSDPALQRMALGQQKDNPNADACVYIAPGNLVRFSTLKGMTRAEFDRTQAQAKADAAKKGITYDAAPLTGVGDTALSARAKDGEVMVFAFAGDTKIQAGAKNVTPAKLGELVKAIAARQD